jgi:membrane fusion protein (multidrug efflux system)
MAYERLFRLAFTVHQRRTVPPRFEDAARSSMRTPSHALLVSILSTGLAFGAAAGCKSSEAGAPDAAKAVAATPVPTVVAATAAVPDQISVTGSVTADDVSDVVPDTQGKVIAVLVERGQRVKQGDALVKLDTRTAALSVREASANLEALRSQRKLAEDECARSTALFEKGAITQSQHERELQSCTAATQQVAAAEARTQMVTKSISDGIIRAPFAGVVNDKWVSPGEWAAPGTRLITLVDDDPLKLELQVPESAAPRVSVGQSVEIVAVAFPGQVFPAKIVRVAAEVGAQSRALTAEAVLPPGTPLRPGMFAEARLSVGERQLPVVPRTALVKRGASWRLFAVVKGHLEERVVQLGPSLPGDRVGIIQGLTAGEKVANPITAQVIDGLRVE